MKRFTDLLYELSGQGAYGQLARFVGVIAGNENPHGPHADPPGPEARSLHQNR